MKTEPGYAGDATILRYLLEWVSAAQAPLPGDVLDEDGAVLAAKTTYFLLDVDGGGDLETLVTRQIDRLLRQLNHVTTQREVEQRGRVRGRIAWPATQRARFTQPGDPGRYVCREVHNWYDRPENQLIKFMLDRVAACLKAVPGPLRAGAAYFPRQGGRAPLPSAERLARIEAALLAMQHSPRLQRISMPHRITNEHLLAAETAPLAEYRALARMYARYQSVVASGGLGGLIGVGRRVLLLPGSAGGQGERWIRLAAALLRAA